MPILGENGLGGEESSDFSGESKGLPGLGRISGKLLAANLLRNGFDLSVDTDLLYLNVSDKKIGINTDAPLVDLDIDSTNPSSRVLANNLSSDNQIKANNFRLNPEGTISNLVGPIYLKPAGPEPLIRLDRMESDSLVFNGNVISTKDGTDINLIPNDGVTGSPGIVSIQGNTEIDGELYVQGNITVDGNLLNNGFIQVGDSILEDTVDIEPSFENDILPYVDNTHDIGSNDERFRTLSTYRANISNSFVAADLTFSQSEISTTQPTLTFDITQNDSEFILSNISNNYLKIKDNTISSLSNNNIILDASGAGGILLISTTNVIGDLTVSGTTEISGDLSKAGNIIVGDNIFDTVTVVPDFTQSIIPGVDNLYDLGRDAGDSSPRRWASIFIPNNTNVTNWFVDNAVINDGTIEIDGTNRTIFAGITDRNLELSPASGIIYIEELQIGSDPNEITNLNTSTPLTFASTDNGYLKFLDTNAVIIPAGDSASRPATPELGDTRWNTDESYLECFDGSVYQVSTGGGAEVTQELMEEFGNLYSLILG